MEAVNGTGVHVLSDEEKASLAKDRQGDVGGHY